MIHATRDPAAAPPTLQARYSKDDKTEFERARDYYDSIPEGKKIKTYDFSRYKLADVKRELDKIFHGKCAYCESAFSAVHPVDVEHYRPKGPVEGVDGHPGYWWLAAEWTNLLPSCIDCNRRRGQVTPDPRDWSLVTLKDTFVFDRGKAIKTGKQSAFPLGRGSLHATQHDAPHALATEVRLLLDPTRDEPDEHLVFHVDRANLISLVYPKPVTPGATVGLPPAIGDLVQVFDGANAAGASPVGAVSIQVYGLNRLGLVQARTRVLRDLEYLSSVAVELDVLRTSLDDRRLEREATLAQRSADGECDAALSELSDDISMDRLIVDKLADLIDSLRHKIIEKASDESPYSAVARAWIAAYVATA